MLSPYFIFNSVLLAGICSPRCSSYPGRCTFAQEASLSLEVNGTEVSLVAGTAWRPAVGFFGASPAAAVESL